MKQEPAPINSWPFQRDSVHPWAYWHNLFDKNECDKIIEIGNSMVLYKGKVITDSTITLEEIRQSSIAWIRPDEQTTWIFERVSAAIISLNQQFFGFDLYGMVEGFQFTKYEAPADFYGKHIDSFVGGITRKLSISIQLNDSSEFEGGELILHNSQIPSDVDMVQGKLVAFPSYALHEVTPVTEGTRYSLVCWITGPAFK